MKITILTMFPEYFRDFLQMPVISRAIRKGIAEIETEDIRKYAGGSYRHIDDSTFGGGAGMVMRCGPILEALCLKTTEKSCKVMLSPAGIPYDQKTAHCFSHQEHLVLLCGHYEGIDARVEKHMDHIVSIGDYILTGGELGAQVIADSVIRLLQGSLRKESIQEESFENGLLEYPQYTQPADYQGDCVPEILLSGNHEKIRRWRLKESLRRTRLRRPDLLAEREYTEEEINLLDEIRKEEEA